MILSRHFSRSSACITTVVCSEGNLQMLFKRAESCPSLRVIVKMGDVTEEEKEWAKKIGLTLVTMEEVEVSGRSLIPLTVGLSFPSPSRNVAGRTLLI